MPSSASFADFASAAGAGFAIEGAFAVTGGGAASSSSFGVAITVPVTVRFVYNERNELVLSLGRMGYIHLVLDSLIALCKIRC